MPLEEVTETLPPPLPPVAVPIHTQAPLQPRRRSVWPVIAGTVVAMVVLGAAAVAAYVVHDHQQNEIAALKKTRNELRSANAKLDKQLIAQSKAAKAAKTILAATTKKLQKAKKDVTAAKGEASANYDKGFSAGESSGYLQGSYESFESAYNAGYNQGDSDGYYAGYDEGQSAGYNAGYSDGYGDGY